METCNQNMKLRPLTPLRLIRGVMCLSVFLSTAFMFLVYLSPPLAILLRFVSVRQSRRAVSFIFAHWLALWPFFFEKINGTKVFFSGDEIPSKERVLLIANHRTEVDWMYLWDLALRKSCLGQIKYVLKSSLMKLPIFGWAFHVLEFVSVDRKWEVDEPMLRKKLLTFQDPQDPLWFAFFPEGTDFTEQKCQKSKQFAAEVGLPVLSNVLLPKTKGFCLCLEVLHQSLDAVYDVTIAYKYRCPTFLDNVFGVNPLEVHLHVRRTAVEEMPTTEKEATSWLLDTFQFKDKLLTDFKARGQFPDGRTEVQLSTLKCLSNFILVISFTVLFIYLTIFSFWFKMYVTLSCAYLASATYLNVHPLPLSSYLGALLGQRNSQK